MGFELFLLTQGKAVWGKEELGGSVAAVKASTGKRKCTEPLSMPKHPLVEPWE